MNQTLSMEEQEQQSDLPKQETQDFLNQFESLPGAEEKLRASIIFMREALAQKGTPNFKGFWEVRKRCLPLFKESLPGPVRSQLWNDYIDLTREGRRLKNLLDEETAFAVEQIDLAISALEEEISTFHSDVESVIAKSTEVLFPESSSVLEKHFHFFESRQKQLNILNVYASRINSLRKELIRTEMRIRQKNQFFQRLSQLGDKVFPIRKDLIREVSETFAQDVSEFVETYFSTENFSYENIRRSVFFFREEIKILQSSAKILTLNTHAFSATREQLSYCWDKLKGMEKELKKEFAQQKHKSAENVQQVRERLQSFINEYQEGKFTLEEAYAQLESVSRWMRELELTRQDVRSLKKELADAREPLDAIKGEEEEKRRQKQAEFEQARRQKVEEFKEKVEALAQNVETGNIETLLEELEECRKTFGSISLLKMERHQLDRKLKTIRDQVSEKQEQALIALSDDDRATLDNLNSILEQRKERRKEVKAQIEEYRKISGGSGLDIEKAMRMQELMNTEKERLTNLDQGITEIQVKIRDLKKRV